MHPMEWSQELSLRFVLDYRGRPELWSSSDGNYKNKRRRNEALRALAAKYGTDVKTVLNKIKSLRSYFHKEHSKVARRGAGDGGDASNWFAYKSLAFILDNGANEVEDSDPACDECEDACSTPDETLPQDDGRESSPCPASKQAPKSSAAPAEVYAPPAKKKKPVAVRDEPAIFGEYVAAKLRKLRDARLQAVLQNRITNMLFEAEMGLLGDRGSHAQSGGQQVLEPEITLVESNGCNFINFLSSIPGADGSSPGPGKSKSRASQPR